MSTWKKTRPKGSGSKHKKEVRRLGRIIPGFYVVFTVKGWDKKQEVLKTFHTCQLRLTRAKFISYDFSIYDFSLPTLS